MSTRLVWRFRARPTDGYSCRGQAVVEFALVSVTLLLFLFGTIDVGRAIYYYDVLSNAARDGARRASVTSGNSWSIPGNQPAVYPSSSPYLGSPTIVGAASARGFGMDTSSLQVTVSAPYGTASGLQLPVTVVTQYLYQPMASGLLGLGAITVTASSTMVLR